MDGMAMPPQLRGPGARSVTVIECPKSMVGRVIGKQGETIKALQTYTGALIQIDQTVEPTKVTISGTPNALTLATSMVMDIVKGTFKGFALLRQVAAPQGSSMRPSPYPVVVQPQPRPVYAPGYGLIPPSQLYGAAAEPAAGLGAFAPRRRDQMQPVYAWNGQVTPSQVILAGIQPGAHTMGQNGGGLLNTQMQQLSVQQVYGGMPVPSAHYGTQLAYFPSDFNSASISVSQAGTGLQPGDGGATYVYQDPSAAGTSTAKLFQAAGGGGMKQGRPNWNTKPQGAAVVEELLGGPDNGVQQGPGGPGGNLVPVMDSETGKVFYYDTLSQA